MKTTLLTNIFNEEYLLPFWLQHHKDMFDDIIIINYRSTDNSMEICKSICPNCKIIETRNRYFDCDEIDIEFMEIENSIEGIKIVLNTTEFLICETSVHDIFDDTENLYSYNIKVISPYSNTCYNIDNYYDLFKNLVNDDVTYHFDRQGTRQIHNFPNGRYHVGRHITNNKSTLTNKAHVIWFGFYPWNDRLLKRKLQISQNMTEQDKNKGFGSQHFWSKERMESVNREQANSVDSLKNLNPSLYNLLINKYIDKCENNDEINDVI